MVFPTTQGPDVILKYFKPIKLNCFVINYFAGIIDNKLIKYFNLLISNFTCVSLLQIFLSAKSLFPFKFVKILKLGARNRQNNRCDTRIDGKGEEICELRI